MGAGLSLLGLPLATAAVYGLTRDRGRARKIFFWTWALAPVWGTVVFSWVARGSALLPLALALAVVGWIATSVILIKGNGGGWAKAGRIAGMAAVLLLEAVAAAGVLG